MRSLPKRSRGESSSDITTPVWVPLRRPESCEREGDNTAGETVTCHGLPAIGTFASDTTSSWTPATVARISPRWVPGRPGQENFFVLEHFLDAFRGLFEHVVPRGRRCIDRTQCSDGFGRAQGLRCFFLDPTPNDVNVLQVTQDRPLFSQRLSVPTD